MTESTNRSTTRLNLTRFDHRNKNITVGPTCNKQYVVHVQIVCTFVVLPCRTIDVQRSIICSALWKYGSTFVLSYKVRKYESTFESTLYESTKVLPYNVVRKYESTFEGMYEGTKVRDVTRQSTNQPRFRTCCIGIHTSTNVHRRSLDFRVTYFTT